MLTKKEEKLRCHAKILNINERHRRGFFFLSLIKMKGPCGFFCFRLGWIDVFGVSPEDWGKRGSSGAAAKVITRQHFHFLKAEELFLSLEKS